MAEGPRYKSAQAFRTALEERLRQRASTAGIGVQRYRYLVVFERFLARLLVTRKDWILKGGYAMELRVQRARTTKDIDLSLRDSKDLPTDTESRDIAIRTALQEAAAIDLGDFFTFTVEAPRDEITGAPYGGTSFPIQANLDGREFQRFFIDVVVGDPPADPIELLESGNLLAFAGIPAPTFPAVVREQQMAEKIHAYSHPRENNSRSKDLVDMVLLIKEGDLRDDVLVGALQNTFDRRSTHSLPEQLVAPPEDWAGPYAALAAECGIQESLAGGFELVKSKLDPIFQKILESGP